MSDWVICYHPIFISSTILKSNNSSIPPSVTTTQKSQDNIIENCAGNVYAKCISNGYRYQWTIIFLLFIPKTMLNCRWGSLFCIQDIKIVLVGGGESNRRNHLKVSETWKHLFYLATLSTRLHVLVSSLNWNHHTRPVQVSSAFNNLTNNVYHVSLLISVKPLTVIFKISTVKSCNRMSLYRIITLNALKGGISTPLPGMVWDIKTQTNTKEFFQPSC